MGGLLRDSSQLQTAQATSNHALFMQSMRPCGVLELYIEETRRAQIEDGQVPHKRLASIDGATMTSRSFSGGETQTWFLRFFFRVSKVRGAQGEAPVAQAVTVADRDQV